LIGLLGFAFMLRDFGSWVLGYHEVLGLFIENTEGAKFWLKVFNDLKTRGVGDILIAVTDGLKGIGEALGAVFLSTTLQTCIVHLIRNSLDYASWKDRKLLAAALKPIYTAPSAEAAAQALDEFEASPWVGPALSDRGRLLAARLGSGDTVLRVCAGGAQADLHDQCHRESAQPAAKDHQDPRALPQRRCGHQANLAGLAKHWPRQQPKRSGMERRNESIRDRLQR
jgi:hypothetical protein